MDLPIGKKQGKEFWRAHFRACASYEGSVTAYCKEHGLSKSSMGYYREKFSDSKKSKFAVVKTVEGPAAGAEASLPKAQHQRLSDPK